jgi:hypothetical protein
MKESADSAARERLLNDEEKAAAIAQPLHDLVREFKAYQDKQDKENEGAATRERVTIAALIMTMVFTFLPWRGACPASTMVPHPPQITLVRV